MHEVFFFSTRIEFSFLNQNCAGRRISLNRGAMNCRCKNGPKAELPPALDESFKQCLQCRLHAGVSLDRVVYPVCIAVIEPD